MKQRVIRGISLGQAPVLHAQVGFYPAYKQRKIKGVEYRKPEPDPVEALHSLVPGFPTENIPEHLWGRRSSRRESPVMRELILQGWTDKAWLVREPFKPIPIRKEDKIWLPKSHVFMWAICPADQRSDSYLIIGPFGQRFTTAIVRNVLYQVWMPQWLWSEKEKKILEQKSVRG